MAVFGWKRGILKLLTNVATTAVGEIGMSSAGRPSAFVGGVDAPLSLKSEADAISTTVTTQTSQIAALETAVTALQNALGATSTGGGTVQTTNTAATTCFSIAIPTNTWNLLYIEGLNQYDDGTNHWAGNRFAIVRNNAGTVTIPAFTNLGTGANQSYMRVSGGAANNDDQIVLAVSGTNINVQVQAESATNKTWRLWARMRAI